jgi:hypothetical protein
MSLLFMNNAEICRSRNWKKGTMFQVEDETGAARFIITAVGEEKVSGRQIASMEFGFSWSIFTTFNEIVIGVNLEKASRVMKGSL